MTIVEPTSISPVPKAFGRQEIISIFMRAMLVSALMLVAGALAVWLSRSNIAMPGLTLGFALCSGLCIWKAMALGLFFGSYPPGDENAMIRLGLVTFCRTGIPLLVVLVGLNYATRPDSATKYMLLMYCVGFFSSLVLEVWKLKNVDSPVQSSPRG